jgi:hypothetical protein
MEASGKIVAKQVFKGTRKQQKLTGTVNLEIEELAPGGNVATKPVSPLEEHRRGPQHAGCA